MAFDPFVAIRFLPYYAHRTGWPDLRGQVFGVLGFHTRNPTALEFVTAVREWQLAHPPLHPDGMLGPYTWNELLPVVRGYTGAVPTGTCPDWVGPATHWKAAGETAPPQAVVVGPVAHAAEDRAIQTLIEEWVRIGGKLEANPFVAIPVSSEYASDETRKGTPCLSTDGICGVLQIGQVWSGLEGFRTIVALIPEAPSTVAAVIFVTDSGRAYYQAAEAWSADYLAGVYAGVTRHLTPLQTLGNEEIKKLIEQLRNAG